MLIATDVKLQISKMAKCKKQKNKTHMPWRQPLPGLLRRLQHPHHPAEPALTHHPDAVIVSAASLISARSIWKTQEPSRGDGGHQPPASSDMTRTLAWLLAH